MSSNIDVAVRIRAAPPAIANGLIDSGTHPVLARLFAARGIRMPAELDHSTRSLLPPDQLKGATAAARLLAVVMQKGVQAVL